MNDVITYDYVTTKPKIAREAMHEVFSLSLQGTIIQFTTATQTPISIRTLPYERKYNEAMQTMKGCSSSASTCGSPVLGINACLLGEMIDRDGRESSELKSPQQEVLNC